ncbi:MAG: hypothetical protein ABIT07_12250 [Ferruginibacter sp.]
MKKFFSILLLLIISIQFLPVKEMGKCLFDNTFPGEEMAEKGIEKSFDPVKELLYQRICLTHLTPVTTVFFSISTKLHTHPDIEITSPPPNA